MIDWLTVDDRATTDVCDRLFVSTFVGIHIELDVLALSRRVFYVAFES